MKTSDGTVSTECRTTSTRRRARGRDTSPVWPPVASGRQSGTPGGRYTSPSRPPVGAAVSRRLPVRRAQRDHAARARRTERGENRRSGEPDPGPRARDAEMRGAARGDGPRRRRRSPVECRPGPGPRPGVRSGEVRAARWAPAAQPRARRA
jgi:hypothetical protein